MTTPGSSEPRFPHFDVVKESRTWDDTTKGVVLARLGPAPPVRFFTATEEPTARVLVDRLLGQDEEPRIPVLEMIDVRLLEQEGDGYRYVDMPEDWEAWRQSIANLDKDGHASWGSPFWELSVGQQMELIERVREHEGDWYGLPAKRVFSLWMRYVCDAFYSHPWTWNEIGFGGPAYPRGYKNLGLDRRENWEVPERHPVDPIPWVRRAEEVRKQHADAITPPNEDPGELGSPA